MKEGLLENIRSFGHWRVNFQPLRTPSEPLLLGRCRELVQLSKVSLRGWDFPHINHRIDDEGGSDSTEKYVENWTEWSGFFEFWRMYKSSQFLAYLALREDTRLEDHGNPSIPVLNMVGTVYSITEFVEFGSRLHSHGVYNGGARLSVELRNTKDRALTAGMNRIPFFERYATGAENLRLERELSDVDLTSGHRTVAADLCVELFDYFGWNPARSQIETEVDRFYRREFAY